ncbi:pyroglutamyl-peptidase I [Catenulispora sp. NL8]|uniref:Pyroglutamyl-peptidase I n=1 Tax=Catenulispora pinistramenti TaxID=2705254 RepID=A0ABS5KX91_9ACTN|nr:pyroglutamyl-peptidase I [Catenulispora pinistramenti]MBS2550604.1 pyroglutamyl-peptidase I [Catenulispora pinistramenti]
MSRVLLTGFEPFGGDELNSSWEAVRLVGQEPPAGLELSVVRLDCVFGRALEQLAAAIRETDPDVVVCVGQASGRLDVTVERVAINLDEARIPDNAGVSRHGTPVVADGPTAYFSALPVKACVAAVRAAGVPASLSYTAGTFVCNHVFYGLMHCIATERPGTRGGFVHVPALPDLPAVTVADGLRALLTTAVRTREDIAMPAGETH